MVNSAGGDVDRYVNRRLMMMPRVVNSLGPFLSLSKSIPRSVGKRVEWILGSSWRASDVVHKAFKHNSVSCKRLSSCSSL